jgi:hypothetical protein
MESQAKDLAEDFGNVSIVASLSLAARACIKSLSGEPSETLVLVAGDRYAVFCSNRDGVSQMVSSVVSDRANGVHAWLDATTVSAARPNRGAFARELVEILKRQLVQRPYDDILILAGAAMRDELRRVTKSHLCRLLNSHPTDSPSILSSPRHRKDGPG